MSRTGVCRPSRPALRVCDRPERRSDRTARDSTRERGSLAGTSIFLGCSDVDPHIPKERVHQTAQVLRSLDGKVTMQLYPGLDHTISSVEIGIVRNLMKNLIDQT